MPDDVKEKVRKAYAKTAKSEGAPASCCANPPVETALSIGYSQAEIGAFPEANMGLGCGNPTALAGLREGETVLDLGSGPGFDAFLAARRVGPKGRVIGVDMTEVMVDRAKANAERYGLAHVEFRLGDIEALPVEDASVDVVISNCVINLAPDKEKVFSEAYRVLRKGGRMLVSDIVLLGELTPEQRADPDLLAGCVAGAIPRDEYLSKIAEAGFSVEVVGEDRDISERQYGGIALESIKVKATKR